MATTFKDTKGREYECIVTLQTVIELRKIDVNLNDLFKKDSDLTARLDDDPALFVDVLCIICGASIHKNIATDNNDAVAIEFASSLGGTTLADANAAMWEAIASFYPPSQRTALMKVWTKTQELATLSMAKLEKAAESLTLESLSISRKPAGDLPDSQAE